METAEKEKLYAEAIEEIKGRLEPIDGGNVVPRMATVVAILKNKFPYYFWCGFYFAEEDSMIAGPYQGTCACPKIAYSGVCGTAARKKETLVVPDVHKFPGHIACDAKSNSEIVVPLIEKDQVIAVLDIDSSELNSFDDTDKKYLEEIMKLVLIR